MSFPTTLSMPVKIGFVPARRGFFSVELTGKMRQATIDVFQKLGVEVVFPSMEQTSAGCVHDVDEAEICAKLFRDADVQGIVIGCMNFGDEHSLAWVVKKARLDVPVFIFGCQEEEVLTPNTPRRDSFCGLLSAGEAMRQIGAKYSVGTHPICFPSDPSFEQDLDWFVRVCRVVHGVKTARFGQLGMRPEDFWTCRFDEKMLQKLGTTCVTSDLSEVIAGVKAIDEKSPEYQAAYDGMKAYCDTSNVADVTLVRLAKLEAWIRQWIAKHHVKALGIQCWNAIQELYGSCSCAVMSRLGNEGIPCACEADILGALSMYSAMLASERPAGLADWNNLHNEDDELANIWHCGVFPKAFSEGCNCGCSGSGSGCTMGIQDIIVAGGGVKKEDGGGTIYLRVTRGPLTLCRVNQVEGRWKLMVAEGMVEENVAKTFGGYGWCRIPNLQRLYRDVLLRNFTHHVAITQNHVGNVLWEAFGNYLGMDTYHATQETPGLWTPKLPF